MTRQNTTSSNKITSSFLLGFNSHESSSCLPSFSKRLAVHCSGQYLDTYYLTFETSWKLQELYEYKGYFTFHHQGSQLVQTGNELLGLVFKSPFIILKSNFFLLLPLVLYRSTLDLDFSKPGVVCLGKKKAKDKYLICNTLESVKPIKVKMTIYRCNELHMCY